MRAQMDILIEPFHADDTDPVLALFVDALSSYYGGDHVAHFNRLIKAYDNGNLDEIGYNSTWQVGVVARCTRTNTVIGFLNYVVKRQKTAKVSPIVVDPKARGRGVGHRLLAHMYQVLSDIPVRNVYCTVDKQNRSTVNFFTHEGFRVVGSSRDQYLKGHCELILQRSTCAADAESDSRIEAVSLVRAETEDHWKELGDRAASFASNEALRHDISEIKAAAIRESWDVESKPKIVYLAYTGGDLIGALILCPKKGGSTKISTAFWKNEMALSALLAGLTQVDEFINTAGRVYIHMPMTPKLVQVMQARGWRLDAVIPGADSEQVVIGQWSTNRFESATQVRPEWPDYHLELQQVIRARDWHKLETPQDLAISLMAEVGELAQELQWKSRADLLDLDTQSIAAELADIYNYLHRLSWHLNIDLLQSCFDKLENVKDKYPVALAKGNSKKYTQFV